MPTIGMITKLATGLYLSVVLWVGLMDSMKPPQMTQSEQIAASVVRIEDIDTRLKVVEAHQVQVIEQLSGVAVRSEIDHQLILGIALAVVGKIVSDVWRSVGKQRTRATDKEKQ